MKKVFLTMTILTSLALFGSFGVGSVQAVFQDEVQKQLGAAAGEQGANLGQARDPRLVVSYVIQIFLGLVGTMFIAYLVYAGYLWMTSAGEEEKVKQAQKIIANCVIGIAITLCAYGITLLVTRLATGQQEQQGGFFFNIDESQSDYNNPDPQHQDTFAPWMEQVK